MSYLKIKGLLTKFKNNSESLSYVFGGGANSALNFLNSILIIELFSESAFGIYLLMAGAVTLIVPCICLDIYRYIDKEAQRLSDNLIGFQLTLSIILSTVIVLLSLFIDKEAIGVSDFALYGVVLASLFNSINLSLLVIFKNEKRFLVNSFGEFLKFFAITLMVLLFSFFDWNSDELATFLVLISNFVVSIYLLVCFFCSRGRIRTYSFSEMKESIRYSLPYIPYSFANFINSQLDKFLLAGFFDVKTVGIYGFIVQLLSPIKVLSNALSKRFSRIYYSNPLSVNKYRTYRNKYLTIMISFSLLNLLVATTYLYVTEKVSLILAVVAMVFLANFMVRSYKQLLMVINSKNGKSIFATYDFLIITSVSVLASILLIPSFGGVGAALAVALSTLASCLFFHAMLSKLKWI